MSVPTPSEIPPVIRFFKIRFRTRCQCERTAIWELKSIPQILDVLLDSQVPVSFPAGKDFETRPKTSQTRRFRLQPPRLRFNSISELLYLEEEAK